MGDFQKLRIESSQPQSGNWKEVNTPGNYMNRKADLFPVELLNEDPVPANTSKNPAKPCQDFGSTETRR